MLGQVKTRLGRDIGEAEALSFYVRCLTQVISECNAGNWLTEISVASQNDAKHPIFANHRTTPQVDGDLGQRMRTVLECNSTHHTLIIGSDIPQLRAKHIATALTALRTHDLVFGPASDGGFWAVGCRQSVGLPAQFMKSVRWSSEHALEDTLRTIPPDFKFAQVDMLSDVDNLEGFLKQKKTSPT